MVASEPGLWTLAGAYFHQDYDLEGPDVDGVISLFARESGSGEVARTIAEIDQLLASGPSDDDLKQLWRGTYRSAFEPDTVGLTYRGWFEHMLEVLRAASG